MIRSQKTCITGSGVGAGFVVVSDILIVIAYAVLTLPQ